MANLVCPVVEFAGRKEYRVKRIIQEEELAEEEIDLEVGHVGDEEVEIEVGSGNVGQRNIGERSRHFH